MSDKWDRRFLEMAKEIASYSKDPSTQCGAVVVDKKRRVVSMGYNGFPRDVGDSPERYANRELKYRMVVHAEVNAVIFAARDLEDYTLYTWPFMPCCNCAGIVIQSGIRRCVAPPMSVDLASRWTESVATATQMFQEAGVELCIIDMDEYPISSR